jgi:hypothetical protein
MYQKPSIERIEKVEGMDVDSIVAASGPILFVILFVIVTDGLH